MRKAVLALLSGAYLLMATTVAALFWRAGAGWGAASAVLVAGLALAFALQGLIGRALEAGKLRKEIAAVREAHRLLADQLEKTEAGLAELHEAIHAETEAATEALTTEVRMLEDLVGRLSDSLDARNAHPFTGAAGPSGKPAVDHALVSAVREALAENRVDLYLQPVVNLPQRRTMFYESFTRLRDASGRVLMPAEYLAVAEPAGLVSAIDNLLLFRCVQIVRRLAKNDRKIGIFCNISLASLGDENFFPAFLDFLSENRDLAGALIFELGQDAFRERGGLEARNMAKLADLGFRFSIDKVVDLDFDFQDLSRADVKFAKVSANVLLDQLLEVEGRITLKSLKDLQAGDFAALTRRYGVELIAEKIESERQVIDVLELDIGFGQGHLFGEPRAIRDAVLAETQPPVEFMQDALRRRTGTKG